MLPSKVSEYLEDETIFLEQPELGGYFRLAIGVDKVLKKERTRFQDLAVVEAGPLGRVLLLDRSIQVTQFDEAAYHEMLVHVPLLSHPAPERVLVIGGGDGGTVREVLKHPGVADIDLCEIDGKVIQVSREFLPDLAVGLDDPKVNIHLADGVGFVGDHQGDYDIILVDSSDPEGPAEVLFSSDFYTLVKRALRPGGLVCSQAESFYLYAPLIQKMMGFLADLFPLALYYTALVPTYLSGIIGFAISSLGPDPLALPDPARLEALGDLRYYTPALHRAAFALPRNALALLPPETAEIQANI